MMAALIDRKQLKASARELLSTAQVSPKAMTALYLGITLLLDMLTYFSGDSGILSTFVSILVSLITTVLNSGFVLYCMAIRRGERAEFLTLFDGFSFAGKIIVLNIMIYVLVFLWSLLFVIPGIIAAYRYRFALYDLYENPGITAMEALAMSKRQTAGYKSQLFTLDLSYFGWLLLGTLPLYVETVLYVYELSLQLLSGAGYVSALPSAYAILPLWAWSLLEGLWSLFISLFYLPNYQSVELGYFEIAKSTSGITSSRPFWTDGSDDAGTP